MMIRSRYVIFTAFMISAFSCDSLLAQTRVGVMLREGVIINKEKQEVLLINPRQELEVVSAKNGTLVWNTQEKLKPLALFDGALLGQSVDPFGHNNFLMKTIDLKTKGRIISTDSIQLPKHVNVDFFPRMSSLFSTNSKWVGRDLYISWQYQEKRPLKGVRTEELDGGDLELETGVIKVASDFGNAISLFNNDVPDELQQSIVANPSESIVGLGALQFLSADKRHILVSEKVVDDTTFLKFLWKIYQRDGSMVGQVRDYRSYAPFYVTGDTLLYEVGPYRRQLVSAVEDVPLNITAMKLSNGATIWRRLILDNFQRISLPPKSRER